MHEIAESTDKGEDTEFFLKKGFRVVSIEANPELAALCDAQYKDAVESGKLIIINKAISETPGSIDFYINQNNSVWGTTNLDWVRRNEKQGTTSTAIKVEAVTIASIIETYGVPYYMKIDIEGSDTICLAGLKDMPEKPKFISVESSATSIGETFSTLDTLDILGYKYFEITSQHDIEGQKCPIPAREGTYCDHEFKPGSSGLFGEETPGMWQSLARVKSEYRRIHFECRMVGPHNGIFRNLSRRSRLLERLLDRMFPRGKGWFDTHATY